MVPADRKLEKVISSKIVVKVGFLNRHATLVYL